MDSTSWISRISFKASLALAALIGAACSGPQISKRDSSAAQSVLKKIHSKPLNHEPDAKFFKELSSKYGLEKVRSIKHYAIDFNGDDYVDLAILPSEFTKPRFFFFHPSKNQFEEVFLNASKHPSFLVFADLDNDSVWDMISIRHPTDSALETTPLTIFRGKQERPFDFLPGRPLRLPFHRPDDRISSVAPVDVDSDGDLDLVLGYWLRVNSSEASPDRILINEGGKFTSHLVLAPITSDPFHEENALPTYAITSCDVNNDERPDILTSSGVGAKNQLLVNTTEKNGTITFENLSDSSSYAQDSSGKERPRGGGFSLVAVCADYNNDGAWDVFSGEMFSFQQQEVRDQSSILTGTTLKSSPSFLRTIYSSDQLVLGQEKDERAVWEDFDNDGLLDLVVQNNGGRNSHLLFFKQAADHSYSEISGKLGLQFPKVKGLITLDVNRDHRPDLIFSSRGKIRVLINQTPVKKAASLSWNGKKHSLGYSSRPGPMGFGWHVGTKQKKNPFVRNQRYLYPISGGAPSQNEARLFLWPSIRK